MRKQSSLSFWLKTLSAILLSLCGSGMAVGQTAGSMPLKFAAEVPLLECDGTPCIEAQTSEGKTWKLGIDTGNVNSVADTKAAESAELKPTKPTPKDWPAGMFITAEPAVQIGSVTLKDVHLLAMSLADDISKGTMPHVDGTLAYTAFKDRTIQLDFVNHKFRVSEPLTEAVECGKPCATFSLITFGKQGPPIVAAEGFEINGKAVTTQVDTMYTGSLLIYGASIEKLGLSDAARTKETRKFLLTDGGVDMKVAPAKQESFRGVTLGGAKPQVYFPTEGVHEPDGLFDATVGLQALEGRIVTLNFHDKTISITH